MKPYLIRLLILLLCLPLMYLSFAFRTGGIGPSDFLDTATDKQTAAWQFTHPDTDIQLSEQALSNNDLKAAEQLALNALSKNITNGKATAQLMSVYEKMESLDTSDQLAGLSESLWPAHIYTRSRLAEYWLKRQRLDKAILEWSTLMIQEPGLQKQLFPLLQAVANEPSAVELLQPIINQPPNWWTGFFSFMALTSEQMDTVGRIYQARIDSDEPLNSLERKSYVQRLIKDNLWDEAYFAWLGGLEEDQLKLSGLIYDGGFEGNQSATGFDWTYSHTKNIKIETTSTNGMSGKQALHISLSDKSPLNFSHVSQQLKLQAGHYSFQARFRLDRLETRGGLCWRVRCLPDKKSILMETKPLIGRAPWDSLQSNFVVPTDKSCPTQLLRLEACSKYAHDQSFKGSIWFDDLAITRQNAETVEEE